ncbi:MAG TPA: aspartyl protease family protein [Pyrinomonadaceae bacterium]|jgi:predicted aspartyl protease/thioredoxin-like negative regulator of GroEL|nr:aspartyl protease family protein [Pyrinomonadaceae bacterium]
MIYFARAKFGIPLALAAVIILCITTCAYAFGDHNTKALNRAEKALRSGDFQGAEKMYRDLLAKDDTDLEARLGLSRALLKQRRLQDAFDHAARVIAIDPLSARGHALLGAAILASGDFRLSVEEFRTALSLNENEAMAIGGLAMVDYYENRTYACIVGLRRAVSIDPDEPDYVFNLGQAAARSERYKEAADAYERFLMVAPRTDADRRARIKGLIDFLRYLGQQGSLYNLEGADRTLLSFDSPDFRPVLKLRINGSKQYLRFVLDTGSGMSVLSEETARRLGVKPVARGGLARAVGGGGRFEIVYGYLNSIEIGDLRVTNVPVYIRHFFDEQETVDGYLGIAALSRLVASVDYGTNRLVLTRPKTNDTDVTATRAPTTELDAERPGVNIPVRTTASGFLSGEVNIDGIAKPLNFIIDTGATVTVLSEKAAALEDAQRFIKQGRMKVYGAAGIADDVKIAALPRLAIGAYSREGVDAAVLDLEPVNETAGFQQSGILGGNFLRHYRVIFDFPRSVVRLESLEASPNSKGPTPEAQGRQ